MIYRRIIPILAVALVIVGASYLFANYRASGSPAPSNVSISLEASSADRSTASVKTSDELIEFWRGRFERDPRDYISLTYLGEAFIRKGRETGDINTFGRAENALREALALNPNYEVALAYLGSVLLTKHDFEGALEMAKRVYATDPRALQALATIGDAQLELGNYTEAEAAYRQLAEESPSPPVYSRLARLAWLEGHTEEALELMQRATDEATDLGLPEESVAWYHFQLGDFYFDAGHLEKAARQFETALGLFDDYYLALVGLGEIRAAESDYEEAIDLYERAVTITAQPDFLASLGYLYEITGQVDEAQRLYNAAELTVNQSEVNRVIYNRQLSLFYADSDWKVDEALNLAEWEIAVRKDIHAYDTLAWALYKNGRYQEAAEAIDQAMKFGTRDASLFYHAGMIDEALGDSRQAQEMLAEALTINPHFDLLQARVARETLERMHADRGD